MSSAVNISYSPFENRGTLAECIDSLKAGIEEKSADYPGRVSAMDLLAKRILSPTSAVRQQVPTDGLAYLATFLQRSHLERLISRELRDIGALTEFVRVESHKSVRVLPRGLVCHWVAGNVPLLAVFSWALSAVLGNRNLIRLSTRQNDLVSPFLQELRNCSAAGAAIADETVVVTFDSQNLQANQQMSEASDVRIAWGGKEAVDAIRGLPANWECEDIVFGPRVSLAVIDPMSIDEGGVRRLATDIAVFDQLACSSPQCIFVKGEHGSRDIQNFTKKFSSAFESQAKAYPRHELDFSESYQIGLDRARILLDGGEVFSDRHTDWTVAVVERPNDVIQCANRFVQIVPFKSFDEIYELIPVNVQTVVTQLGSEDLAVFTERAAHFGVCRFPRPGEGNNFDNPWDGIGLVSRLTRAVLRTDAD